MSKYKYTIEQAKDLYARARRLKLLNADYLADPERVAAVCNGVGPACWPEVMRKLADKLSPVMELAAAMHDIGYHFPDTKGNEFEGIDSKILLRRVMEMLREVGYELGNCDITICAQAPKLNPFIDAMQACLAEVMGVAPNQVSIKATTTEHLGFVGREEGIAAYAVALINHVNC